MNRAKNWKEGGDEFSTNYEVNEVRGDSSFTSLLRNTLEIPKLSETALYGPAGQIVRKIEPNSETHPAALLVQLLVGVGNLIGRTPYMLTECDRRTPTFFA